MSKFADGEKIRKIDFAGPVKICGILNVTPDSFSDGGLVNTIDEAVAKSLALIKDGAGIIDIGGESTRPGYTPVTQEEEIRRVVPAVSALRGKTNVPISVDTTKSQVALEAIRAGADIINDVSGMLADPDMLRAAAASGCYCVVNHNVNYVNSLRKKNALTLTGAELCNDDIDYVNRNSLPWEASSKEEREYALQVRDELLQLAKRAEDAGISKDKIILDPGVGFKGSIKRDYAILGSLSYFTQCGYPVMLGVSRKSCLAACFGEDIYARDEATAMVSAMAVRQNVAILRVHNVKKNAEATEAFVRSCQEMEK